MKERSVTSAVLLFVVSLFLLFLLVNTMGCKSGGVNKNKAVSPLVIGSYQYKTINRADALNPLVELVATVSDREVELHLATDPAELADWVFQGKVDIAVPNLVAYLEMKLTSERIFELAVPAKPRQGDHVPYTSSIVVNSDNHMPLATHIDALLASSGSINIVWPTSASGGLIGSAWLLEQFPDKYQSLQFNSVGTHQKVLEAVSQEQGNLGVVATKVYLEQSISPNLMEIWRSDPIPFPPMVCREPLPVCRKLQSYLLQNNETAQAVLKGLITGWPEYQGSESFTQADLTPYQPIIKLLQQITTE